MNVDLFRALVADAATVVARIAAALRDGDSLRSLARRLGWDLAGALAPLTAVATQARAAADVFLELDDASDGTDWLALASAVNDVHGAIVALDGADFGSPLNAAGFATEFPQQLLHWAVIEHLDVDRPRVAGTLRALGIITTVARPAAGIRPAFDDTRIVLPDFEALLRSPVAWLRAVWAWGDPSFDGWGFLDRLAEVLEHAELPVGFVPVAPSAAEEASSTEGKLRPHLLVGLIRGFAPASEVELGLSLVALAEASGPVIAVIPYGVGDLGLGVTFSGLQLLVRGMATAGERGLLVRPDGVTVADDPLGLDRATVAGELRFALSRAPGEVAQVSDGPVQASTSGWTLSAGGKGAAGGGSELWIELALPNVQLGLPTAGSGFVGAAVGGAQERVPVSLTMGLSTKRGLYVGPTGLTHDRAVSLRLGALEAQRISVELAGIERGLAAEMRTALALKLGPVGLTVEGLGVALRLRFPAAGGNLGPVDLSAAELAPTGFGVSVDSAVAHGFGQVARVGATEYRGSIALAVLGAQVSGFGMLDDSPGAGSFVAAISAEFSPIQLGLGFTLDGIGGLIAIHRRVDTDALRAALRTPAGMGDIFFPADPIAQADRLTTDLATYFPAAEGRYVFGPAVKFGWGTPTMVRGVLAVLLELPAPARVVVLGTVSAKLPTVEHAIVDLNVDVVGEVDFAQKRVAIDASLRNSTIAGFPITGDMAFRMAWGSPPSFALSIGGFHSQFRTPPGFPELRRIQIPLGAGDDPRLDAQGFLALTSNTAQIGAQVDLYASAGPLNIKGGLGFETLLTFSPFHLQVDVWAGVALRRGTSTLASVHFDGHLSGPKPWRVDGKACLSLWFVDLCVPIHVSFGAAQAVELPRREIWPALHDALATPAAWASTVPPGLTAAVTAPPVGEAAALRIEPCATLTATQKVVPLDRQITAFAQGRPEGADRFEVSGVQLGATAVPAPELAPVTEWFAPAQFEEMSEAAKLSRPGFEQMVGGVSVGATTIRAGAPLVRPLDYETVVVVGGQRQDAPRYRPTRLQQLEGTLASASGRPPLRATGAAAFASAPGTPPRLQLREETFVIASVDELAARSDLAAAGTRGQVELALRAHLAANPGDAGRLQVVPTFEVAA